MTVSYTHLNRTRGDDAEYVACRAGIVNEETKFVLNYFRMCTPQYLGTVSPEIGDIELNLIRGIESEDSIKVAWELMNACLLYTSDRKARASFCGIQSGLNMPS